MTERIEKAVSRIDAFLTVVLLKSFMLQHPFIIVSPFVIFLFWVFQWKIVRKEIMTCLFYEAQIQKDYVWEAKFSRISK